MKTFFFCSSPDFGQKIGLNFKEDLLFFALHLILGKISEIKILRESGAQRDLGARYRPSYLLEKFLSEALGAADENEIRNVAGLIDTFFRHEYSIFKHIFVAVQD